MSMKEEILRISPLLPVGFGFRPTDEELVDHYLKPKVEGTASHEDIIPEVDVYEYDPWWIPVLCSLESDIQTDDTECFFFSPLRNKYSNGTQLRRTTNAGSWKPTGPDRKIKLGTTDEVIGTKKTLVFHAHAGVNTGWIIHEYRTSLPANSSYVLCRLKRKTGPRFPPEIKLNGMDMEIDNPSTGTGIHQNGADGSHPESNVASDIRNYLPYHMTPGESHFTRSAVDSGNQLWHCYIGRVLICPHPPLNDAYGEGGGSSSDSDTQVAQDGKSSFNFPDTASAGHEPISSLGRCLVNLLVGILFSVILIAIMVRDIRGKFSKP